MRGKIPKVEYVFCDTGEELDETYNFIKELEKFLGQKIEWLQTGRNFKFYIELNHLFFYLLFGLLIGFYDGFFGPGTGSFWTMALIVLLGLDLKQATAQTKLFNFTSNIVSLAVFIYSGLVLWTAGLIMGMGQIIGAYLGSTLVSKREVHFIRIFFLIVVAATIIKLSLDTVF